MLILVHRDAQHDRQRILELPCRPILLLLQVLLEPASVAEILPDAAEAKRQVQQEKRPPRPHPLPQRLRPPVDCFGDGAHGRGPDHLDAVHRRPKMPVAALRQPQVALEEDELRRPQPVLTEIPGRLGDHALLAFPGRLLLPVRGPRLLLLLLLPGPHRQRVGPRRRVLHAPGPRHPLQALGVLRQEGFPEQRVLPPQVVGQGDLEAVIQQDDLGVPRRRAPDKDVARVGVAVDEAVAEHLGREELDDCLHDIAQAETQPAAAAAAAAPATAGGCRRIRRRDAVLVPQTAAVNPFRRQDSLRTELGVDHGDVDAAAEPRVVADEAGEVLGVGPLVLEVGLLHDVVHDEAP
ncbi:hypothetical protein CTA2_685 [Colletotrichum tanaceti]|uniref:Uncharacterized protein n=1 Tax=Colletotrichum tanaceti TaxID=1306861 RepID=A0A4V6DGR1_9PEZI|nr:hypothetical protein CTA2_685 [Colletotrichum tanaceti]TKW53786.1 hypothetical protein CTA1_1193 [Colletotrichum tanaceti]